MMRQPYDLPLTSSDALPLSYRILMGAKAIKLGHVKNMQHTTAHPARIYSQFTSHMTSISENEMNIQHVNGMLNVSLEIFLKKMH